MHFNALQTCILGLCAEIKERKQVKNGIYKPLNVSNVAWFSSRKYLLWPELKETTSLLGSHVEYKYYTENSTIIGRCKEKETDENNKRESK